MMVADIDAAEQSVHLSFYIWLGDRNGTKVVEAVCRAARRGVICRIAADAIGSRAVDPLRTLDRDARCRRAALQLAPGAARPRLSRRASHGSAQPPQDRRHRRARHLLRQPELRRSGVSRQTQVRALGRYPRPLRRAGGAPGRHHLRLRMDDGNGRGSAGGHDRRSAAAIGRWVSPRSPPEPGRSRRAER